MNFAWERLGEGVHRCRLPFLDVTIGLVCGETGTLLIDTGTTLIEANAIKADIAAITKRPVSHILLTHNHFDHILGASAFGGASVYCAPEVAVTMADGTAELHAHAMRYGADPVEVADAIAALRPPANLIHDAELDLVGTTVTIAHPGRGHTRHDLIAVIADRVPAVVFCGDLVEESADPSIGHQSDLAAWPATLGRILEAGGIDAVYVPGHGAVVDAGYVEQQQRWLRAQL